MLVIEVEGVGVIIINFGFGWYEVWVFIIVILVLGGVFVDISSVVVEYVIILVVVFNWINML